MAEIYESVIILLKPLATDTSPILQVVHAVHVILPLTRTQDQKRPKRQFPGSGILGGWGGGCLGYAVSITAAYPRCTPMVLRYEVKGVIIPCLNPKSNVPKIQYILMVAFLIGY